MNGFIPLGTSHAGLRIQSSTKALTLDVDTYLRWLLRLSMLPRDAFKGQAWGGGGIKGASPSLECLPWGFRTYKAGAPK